jgi:3-deoxy-D-manno-octulosonic-acid transferase
MIWLYRLLFLPALALMGPSHLRRMRRRGDYAENFGQRLGQHDWMNRTRGGVKRIWLQAVSVGEVFAVAPLLEALNREGIEVYLTTTTSTGYRVATDRYRGLTSGVAYFPIDWWPFSARAWRRIKPDLVILTEGERWPEHSHQAKRRGVPVLCINARISDRSFFRLRLCPPACWLVFANITRLLPCSEQDELRFRKLGVPASRIQTTGNIKLDVAIPLLSETALAQLRRGLGLPPTLVLLGSSTWRGEEEALVEALRAARAGGLRCTLLLVPRHAERRFEIEQTLRPTGLRYHFRSRGSAPGEVDVAVADTTGELRELTQLADLVFVGKSLPPHTEGQTPVEAATLGKPVIFGPGMGNFRSIARELLELGAACEVADARALAAEAPELLRDAGRREALAAAAATWRRRNAGALGRTLRVIEEELGKLELKDEG